MLDLDHFKTVNDTYGRLVGDRVLQSVVRAARQVLRKGDVLLRYGGEEFLIVLPGAGYDDLVQTGLPQFVGIFSVSGGYLAWSEA
jgi:two-component system cell cycle response regulator